MGTLLCRQMTRVHPVVSFTFFYVKTATDGIIIVYMHYGLVGGNPTMNTPRLRRGGGIASSSSLFFTYSGTLI